MPNGLRLGAAAMNTLEENMMTVSEVFTYRR